MTAPSIQTATSASEADILAPVAQTFETSATSGASFAAHLNQAVLANTRPAAQLRSQSSQNSRTLSQPPKQPSDVSPRVPPTAVTAARSTAAQAKQNQSASKGQTTGKASAGGQAIRRDQTQNRDSSGPKDKQRQAENGRNADWSSNNPRNGDGRQAGGEKAPSPASAQSADSPASVLGQPQSGDIPVTSHDGAIAAHLMALLPASQSPAQAVAVQPEAVSSQSNSSSTTQPGDTPAPSGDASSPAALVAPMQGAQGPTQPVAAQPVATATNGQNPAEVNSGGTKDASTTPFNSYFSLAAAYQASLTSVQAAAQAVAQFAPTAGATSTSQPSMPTNGANSLPSLDQDPDAKAAPSGGSSVPTPTGSEDDQFTPLAVSSSVSAPMDFTGSLASSSSVGQPLVPSGSGTSTDGSSSQTNSGNSQSAAASVTLQPVSAASTSPAPTAGSTTPPAASPTEAVASATPSLPGANQAKPAAAGKPLQVGVFESDVIGNLKLAAGQQEAARTLEQGWAAAARATTEPDSAAPQQAAVNATVPTNHGDSPAPGTQPSVMDSQPAAAESTPLAGATQESGSTWTDGSTGDNSSSQAASSTSQALNSSKPSGSPVETLPSSAFNNDGVGGVASSAVHAAAQGTLQSNIGFDNGSFKAPATVSQSFSSAAQEKAFAAWQSVSEQVGRVVNTATLNALQNGTEMRVQLRTDAFGAMDIRATLEGGKVGAAIGVESAEAHNALLGQLPALQQSLSEHRVQLDQISVVSNHEQSATNFGSGKQNGNPTTSGGHRQEPGEPERLSEPASQPVTETWQPETSRGRLSVRA